jgi:hypothetical protein
MPTEDTLAFRRGFLQRCAEEGLTKEAVAARIDAAKEKRAGLAGDLLSAGGVGLGMAAALPPVLGILGGGALGYGAAKATEPDITPEQVQADELINTYRVYAQRAAARKKLRAYRPTT